MQSSNLSTAASDRVFVSRLRVRPVIAWLALAQVLVAIVLGAVTRDVHIESIPMQRVGSTN